MFKDRPEYYILQGKKVVPISDIRECSEFLSKIDNRRVAYTEISPESHVSTVFLCFDHSFTPDGPPILFETLVFGGEMADEMARYSTWDEAVEGHEKMVACVLEVESAAGSDPWEKRISRILSDD